MKKSVLNSCRIGLLVLITGTTGCSRWNYETEYKSPIWKDSDTIYCIERLYQYQGLYFPVDIGYNLKEKKSSYLTSVDTEGENEKRIILLDESDYYVNRISFSGNLVVFSRTDNSVWSINIDGSNKTELISAPEDDYSARSNYADLSNSGDKVAYEVLIPYEGEKVTVKTWIMDVDGSNKTELWTSDHRYVFHSLPRWSPDDTEVGFQYVEGDNYYESARGIRIMNIETKDSYTIPESSENGLDFTPDNDKIIYSDYMLYLIRKDSTEGESISTSDGMKYPRISPDGNRIIGEWDDDWGSRIVIINKDGTGKQDILLPKHEKESVKIFF